MGISVKPSFKRHHGYRTRDRPPTRQAHRSDGLAACDPSQCRCRRPAPNKKPAATDAAGFDHGRFLIRRGMRCRRPPFDDAGGGACRAADDRFVFYHSLLQETSAGRNLITVFSTVNILSQIFFAPLSRLAWRNSPRQVAHDAPRMRDAARVRMSKCKNTGKNASFLDASRSRMHSRGSHGSSPPPLRTRMNQHATQCSPTRPSRRLCASHKPDCAKVRELFSRADDGRRVARGCFARSGNEKPAALAAGPDDTCGVLARVSGLRLPAVRRSRPGSTVR